jgi:hypothetical protein
MSSSTRRSRTDTEVARRPQVQLGSVGLSPGETVRWQATPGGRWRSGVALHLEQDGSLEVRDANGALRSLRLERVQVRRPGLTASGAWEPLTERMGRAEQLTLL